MPEKAPQIAVTSTPAAHSAAVVFCCDDAYLPFASMAALAILSAHREREFDICIISLAPLTVPATLKDSGIRWLVADVGAAFDGFQADHRRGAAMLLRLAVPGMVARDYDRLLYLDSDIVFRHGDLPRLLALDMEGAAIGAVRDNVQWRDPKRRPKQLHILKQPTRPYFNSGVLLMDVAAFQAQGILEKAVEFAVTQGANNFENDQSALNAAVAGEWVELSPLWNYLFSFATRYFGWLEDAFIFHFIGPGKPWAAGAGQLPGELRRQFERFVGEHFPERLPFPDPGPSIHQPKKQRDILAVHLFALPQMQRYLRRFPSPFTTHRHRG